jgi:hypothetical protein
MADYYSPTIIDPTIPDTDMTPLERLLLSHIFDAERDRESWYFFSEQGPSDMIFLTRVELDAAVAASESIESGANAYIKGKISDITPDEAHIDLDMSGTSWEFLFQDIVRRSKTLRYVTAVTSFTCSKMRPDGFGGMAVLITADTIKGKSTHEIIEDFLGEEGIAP